MKLQKFVFENIMEPQQIEKEQKLFKTIKIEERNDSLERALAEEIRLRDIVRQERFQIGKKSFRCPLFCYF